MRWLLLFSGACTAIIGLALGLLWASTGFENLGVSGHGVVAITLGVVLTAGLATGLMALVFLSSRSGYDGIAHRIQGDSADDSARENDAPPGVP